MGFIQKYEWGTIEWLTDQSRITGEMLDIGITSIYPGRSQEKHIHYGDEQWLYVLSGEGISSIDDDTSTIGPGDFLHIPAGAAHETMNSGAVPLVEILISYPKTLDDQGSFSRSRYSTSSNLINVSENEFYIDDRDVESIEAYSKTLSLPINILDTHGGVLYSNSKYPETCQKLCSIESDIHNCHLYKQNIHYNSPAFSEQTAHYCKYGLAVIDTPIVVDGKMIGIIRGGHVLIEQDPKAIHHEVLKYMKNLANVPKGRLRIILMQYLKLSKRLSNNHVDSGDILSDSRAFDTQISTETLKEDLNLALGKILNIQMNNHFLFNTLNAIAGLALDENSFRTYRAVVDLSKLFRYNLRSTQEFVTIEEECNYIRNYIDLQGIRFGDRLKSTIDISESALKHYVPFNTLQPLVENAFVHGFSEHVEEMHLDIRIATDQHSVLIEVEDNGKGVNEEDLIKIEKSIDSTTLPRRGLSMIVDRLHLFFGESLKFQLFSSNQKGQGETGFRILISIPKRTMKREMLR